MDEETISASKMLSDEHRLALDGYRLTTLKVEHDNTLAKIALMKGQQTHTQKSLMLDPQCPTREQGLLTAMLYYLNSGGTPQRLRSIAEVLSTLPAISPNGFNILGTYANIDWVSFVQRERDGQLFEVRHGLISKPITEQQIDEMLDETDMLLEDQDLFDDEDAA